MKKDIKSLNEKQKIIKLSECADLSSIKDRAVQFEAKLDKHLYQCYKLYKRLD